MNEEGIKVSTRPILVLTCYESLCTTIMAVSYANVGVYVFEFSSNSAVNIEYRTGPRIIEELLIKFEIFKLFLVLVESL